jgi:hypothetical protein
VPLGVTRAERVCGYDCDYDYDKQAILRQRGQNAVKLDLDIFYRIWNYKRLTT